MLRHFLKSWIAVLLMSTAVSLSLAQQSNESFWQKDEDTENREVLVRSIDNVVNAGLLKPNSLEITFNFWVESASDSLNLTCLASNLANKKSPSDDSLRKIDEASGCQIATIDAVSLAGQGAETVRFKAEKHKIEGTIDALKSDYVTFKTLGMEPFRGNVFVTVIWSGTARTSPVGDYEASVTLIAEVPDRINPPK